jgi:thymidylate synthase (FAD)
VIDLSDIEKIRDHHENSKKLYEDLVSKGWAKEIARSVLGTAFHTKFMWTCSLQALVNFIKLRNHPAAQLEIQECAKLLYNLSYHLAPISFDALLNEPEKT